MNKPPRHVPDLSSLIPEITTATRNHSMWQDRPCVFCRATIYMRYHKRAIMVCDTCYTQRLATGDK